MRERPILFNGAMVRAILSGAKSQTRRVVKPQPPAGHNFAGFTTYSTHRADEGKAVWAAGEVRAALIDAHRVACPFGQPGDRLWVRETWAQPVPLDPGPTFYRADYPACVPSHFENVPPADSVRWTPSIHMPRKACRLVLEITEVRVERLQAISEADALAEGAMEWAGEQSTPIRDLNAGDERIAFKALWESTGGDWDANPWVWAISFRRLP
ncbi:hypothetical protein FHY35_001381 [Xanthomonas arboricola]|uniref:hypothetical protein n=1 Tax=Xanthomonas arboricola TaxID=56448 RepID=UPI00141B0843|nr:hypothetical protein [Xanthomonas arboricola]NIJ84426.1 hypothetical protein [Xanthomonas arboricola]